MTILHGDDQQASRGQLSRLRTEAKSDNLQIVDLPGSDLTLAELITAFHSASLLGRSNIIFVEGLFSRRPSQEKKAVLDYLQLHPDSQIVIWEPKDVTSQLHGFPPSVTKKFDLPKFIWQFLDSLSLNSLHSALTSTEPEQLLALLAGHLQKLILVASPPTTPLPFPSWQAAKLARQAAKFPLPQLSAMNSDLLTIDLQQKTSAAPYNLTTALELWVLKHIHSRA